MRDRGQATIRAVAEGLADFVIAQSTEIAAVKGVQYLGPLPTGLQAENLVQAALCAETKEREAAQAFLTHLSEAREHWREIGFADP
jgi:molybdate transport system substrate-binding protein